MISGRRRPKSSTRTFSAGIEGGGLAVAQRDRAGLVQEQHVRLVARGFHGPAGHGDGHWPGSCGPCPRCRSPKSSLPPIVVGNQDKPEAHDQGGDGDGVALLGLIDAVDGKGQQGGAGHDGTTMVRPASRMLRAISLGVFWRLAPSTMEIMRSRKLSPRVGGVMQDQPVGKDAGAAGDLAERSPPDSGGSHQRAFAGDGSFHRPRPRRRSPRHRPAAGRRPSTSTRSLRRSDEAGTVAISHWFCRTGIHPPP